MTYAYESPPYECLAPCTTTINPEVINNLIKNNHIKLIGNSQFLHLTESGYKIAMSAIDSVRGSVYDPPRCIKEEVIKANKT
jgi:hypothetical protein